MRFRISENLCIDTNTEVIKKQGLRVTVISGSGSGKSWLMAVIAEQAIYRKEEEW